MPEVNLNTLYINIEKRLSNWTNDWRREIEKTQVPTSVVERRLRGAHFSDSEIFKGLLLALLSNGSKWERIQNILEELGEPFEEFNLEAFSNISEDDVTNRLMPWFKSRKANPRFLEVDLNRLRTVAKQLVAYSQKYGSADSYFTTAWNLVGKDSTALAFLLGDPKQEHKQWKLLGFGVALSAEALRNLGFDLSKPDRHILRAVGQFGLVQFVKWSDRSAYSSPEASPNELRMTMKAVEQIAQANKQTTTFVDSMIWTLCSEGNDKAHLTNFDLAEIARTA